MCPVVIDKTMLVRRFARGMGTYDGAAVVQKEMAARLMAGLASAPVADGFGNVLELGCGTGVLTGLLLDDSRLKRLVLNDLVPACAQTACQARQHRPDITVQFVPGDMETVALPGENDLIIAGAVLQWASDPLRLLRRLAELLRPGGVLAMASFGPSNLCEITRLTGLSLHYRSVADWHGLLADHYTVLSSGEAMRTLWFASAHEVLRHLQQTGVNALDTSPWPPARIRRFCRTYAETFGRDGAVPLTYHPVYLTARKSA